MHQGYILNRLQSAFGSIDSVPKRAIFLQDKGEYGFVGRLPV